MASTYQIMVMIESASYNVGMTNKTPKLTTKQQAFITELISNPKQSATEAASKAYNANNRVTAAAIASENLRKPQIISKLVDYNELVEGALIGTVNDWQRSDRPREREIALDAAKFIHDKVNGKATQSVQVQSSKVVISIDLTSSQDTDTVIDQ